jgi:hypothetical protein
MKCGGIIEKRRLGVHEYVVVTMCTLHFPPPGPRLRAPECKLAGAARRGGGSKTRRYADRRVGRSNLRATQAVLAAHGARVLQRTAPKFRLQTREGGGAPTGAWFKLSAPHSQALPSESAAGAVARHTLRRYRLKALRARSSLGAPRAVLAAQINATAQPRPRFGRTGGCGRYPHHRTLLQRCTSRTGHSAGRSDAQAARERGYKPRPQARAPNKRNDLATGFSG